MAGVKAGEAGTGALAQWLGPLAALAWFAFAGLDFGFTMVRLPAYAATIPLARMDAIDEMAAWGIALWGLQVFAGWIAASALVCGVRAMLVTGPVALVLLGLFDIVEATGARVLPWPQELLGWVVTLALAGSCVRRLSRGGRAGG